MASPRKKTQEYQWSGEIRRIIPLRNNGARIQDEKGKSRTFKRDSSEFAAECARLDAIMEGKISDELESLGWMAAARDVHG